ncbi:MAG: chromosomal replication initiator protein DnaA [Deltaproteobacteria bacterium]|nr:chromosomal replication initiator protein DnaA [Deltaproteobacteria bacterium]
MANHNLAIHSDEAPVTSTTPTRERHDLWQRALDSLQLRIKPHNFDMWLRPISCQSVDGETITLRAPNRYIKEWFEDNYLSIVLQELRQYSELDFHVAFELDERVHEPVHLPETESVAAEPVSAGGGWDADLNQRYRFESFVVGPSNQLAHAASRAVGEMPAAKYNPLFIYGGVGLGKTHLLCAIGHEIRARQPNSRIVYLSSERFVNEYINHLRSQRMEDFRVKYRERCDVLLIDDIQFIAGKTGTQDEFFHTFNALYDLHRQIVVTSDKYPHEIPDLEDRLRTRFQWGLIADIQHPELETRVAILKKKAEVERIHLPNEVAHYLATHIKSNVRELEGSLIRLAAFASLQASEITVQFAQESLKNFLSQATANLSIETVQKEVASYFNLKVADLKSPKRHKAVARPRQIAMYLARKLIGASFPEIGQRFGGKDHSTVISACRKIEELVDKDLSIRTTVEALERQLQL